MASKLTCFVLLFFVPAVLLAQDQAVPSPSQPSAPSASPEQEVSNDEAASEEPGETAPMAEPWEGGPGPVSPSVGAALGTPLAGTSQLGGGLDFGAPIAPEPLIRWGRVHLRTKLTYRISYGTGIRGMRGEDSSSVIHEFSPAATIILGDHWSLNYVPTLRWYSDSRFEDSLDHRVSLNGNTTYRDWGFSLSQGFSRTMDPLIETGQQTDQDAYSTSFRAGRSLGSKMSLDLGVAQNFRFVEGGGAGGQEGSRRFSDRMSWSTMDWLDYKFMERLTFGAGAGFTYDHVGTGSDMTSEQVQGRVNWQPGSKLNLSLSGGVDIRQFLDSEVDGTVSPIFSFSAGYRLFEATSLFASLSRTVSPSYYASTASESTGVSAGLNQRFLQRYFLNVHAGYTTRDYSATTVGTSTVSNQDTTSFGASLGTAFLKRGSISVFYSKTYNESGTGSLDYESESVGAQVAYSF